MNTIIEKFLEQADRNADNVAIYHRGQNTTFATLSSQSAAIAVWLTSNGLSRGDRVALLIPNSAEYVACYLGILRAGGVVVALNPETTVRELEYTLNHSRPRVVVVGSKAAGVLAAVAHKLDSIRRVVQLEATSAASLPTVWHTASFVEICESAGPQDQIDQPGLNDLAQIIYTSGTTGAPKGVTLSHANVSANCDSIIEYLKLTSADSMFVTLPFFYSYGNSLLFTHLAVGARLVLANDFVFLKRALDLLQEQQVTGFAGVPSSYAMLLHKSDFAQRTFEHLRYLTCAGGGLAPAVVERLRTIVPQVELYLMYGQTEATARLSTLMPAEIDNKLGSIGTGIPGVTLAVVDKNGTPVAVGEIGEIVAKGANVMAGYWKDTDATAKAIQQDGLHTGDLARIDDDGYIYIVGRKNDIIKSGAYRINPQEMEDVILQLESVAEVAVVGLADEIWGESPVAFLVPSPNGVVVTADEVLEYSRKHLPRYKWVHEVRIVQSLPKTSSGKIKRSELRDAATLAATPGSGSQP